MLPRPRALTHIGVGRAAGASAFPPLAAGAIRLGCMSIDYVTAKNLELVRDLQTGSQKGNSLYAIMNHTATAVGARLLKAQIVKPPTDAATINMRLDAIESILDDEERFFEAGELLNRFTNLDTLINTLVARPNAPTLQHTKSCIRTVISLQHVLALVTQLGKCVGGFKNSGMYAGPRLG